MRKPFNNRNSGMVLILTIVTLVVLATMLYTLGAKLSAKLHRDQYLIDYQKAVYGCDSAAKYALAQIQDANFALAARPNEPDFSDLFQMSQQEYEEILEEYKLQYADEMGVMLPQENDYNDYSDEGDAEDVNFAELIARADESMAMDQNFMDFNDVNETDDEFGYYSDDPLEDLYIRGPYGYRWPQVDEAMEFEVGDVEVTVEIEDENAKLPLTWGLAVDPNSKKQAEAAVKTFFQWMELSPNEIETLQKQLDYIQEIKFFSLEMPPVIITEKVTKEAEAQKNRRNVRRRTRRSKTTTTSTKRDALLDQTDYSKILHSSLLEDSILRKATFQSPDRVENALKYLGLWGTSKVNINTAPRHVLEATFVFGGDEVMIANAIISMRKIKPFESIDELSKELYQYNDSIEKSKPFITTVSDVFTIHISAYSGTAKASLIAAVKKEKGKIRTIAVFSD